MRRFLAFSLLLLALPADASVHHDGLIEPNLRIAASHNAAPQVALTFDACMGKTDQRILDVLIANKIPSTIFVTARWLARNPETLAVFKLHPDLFELEDHGRDHVPAIDRPIRVYGIASAGSPEAVVTEVEGGAKALLQAGLARPTWYRGATAKYSRSSMAAIEKMGYRIAGFSINGDGGSLLGANVTEHHYAMAKDGDVIISHINQPGHAAGEGVVRGILALKARGFRFVRLDDAFGATVKAAGIVKPATIGAR